MAECFKDVALRVAPVDETAARGMIAETRAAALMQGWRGAEPCDADALVHTIVATSALAAHAGPSIQGLERSEEPESELQSLMRPSYAVCCVKKKQDTQQ